MPTTLNILAETDPTKLIGVAVVVVIWIIGLITQAIKKQQEEKNTRNPADLAEEIQRRLPPVQAPPLPNQQRQQKAQRVPGKKSGKPDWNTIAKQPGTRVKQPRVVPPPPVQTAPAPHEVPVVQTMAAAKEAMTGQVAPKHAPFADARALRRFMNPKILQQQYILTELLQRPMCDRANNF